MQNRSLVVALALFASLGAVACGGSNAASGESAKDPWSDFSGKYSTPGEPRAEKSETAKADKAEGKKSDAKAKAADKSEPTEEATPPSAKKAASKGNVKGESISSVSVDTLTDVSKATLKNKFVSNSVVTGAQYELVQVQLKGATVQITRPAATPQPNGPSVAAPSAKKGEVSKNDASWYDEEADVLVVVSAGKKAAAQKALAAIVKH